MNAIQKAIEVLQGCLEHPGADDAIAGLRAMLVQKPVAHLLCGGRWGDELEDWEIDPDQSECNKINESAYESGQELNVPLFAGHTAQREPLTAEQAKTLMIEASYGFATPQEQADFLNGMRHAEIAHGITKGGA